VVTPFGPLFTPADGVFQAIPLGPIAADGSAAFDVRFASGDHFFNFIVAVSISWNRHGPEPCGKAKGPAGPVSAR
jgi:hypothetical protein